MRERGNGGSPGPGLDAETAGSSRTLSGIDENEFESLLDQVRDLHRRTDEITRSKARLHENVRARLRWDSVAPSLPVEQRLLVDEVVDALTKPRLSSTQARVLYRTYFGR